MNKNQVLASQNAQPTQGTTVTTKEEKICCICGKPIKGHSNNAYPVKDGVCCDDCNCNTVVPARRFQERFMNEIDDRAMRAWWEGEPYYDDTIDVDGFYFCVSYHFYSVQNSWSVVIDDYNLDVIGTIEGEEPDAASPDEVLCRIATKIFDFLTNKR